MRRNKALEIPSSGSELGTRIKWITGLFDNQAKAAEAAGLPLPPFKNQMNGDTRAAFEPMTRLCMSAGIDVNWLATGEGNPYSNESAGPDGLKFDLEHMRELITWTETYLKNNHLPMTAEERGKIIIALYKISMREKSLTGSQISSFEQFSEVIDMIAS